MSLLIEHKTLPFEIKDASGDGSTFAGYANAFNNIDAAHEIVVPGAFIGTIPQWISDGFLGNINHDWSNPIGKITSAREDQKGLFIEGKISATDAGRNCMILLKDGVLKKMSIGYKVLADEYLQTPEEVVSYWKDQNYNPTSEDVAASKYGARLLKRIHLYEASPVTAPANSLADITRVKQLDADETIAYTDIEQRLRSAGLSLKAAKIWVSGLRVLHQRDVEEAHKLEPVAIPVLIEPELPPGEKQEAKEEPEVKMEQEPLKKADTSIASVPGFASRQAQITAHVAAFMALKARYSLHGE